MNSLLDIFGNFELVVLLAWGGPKHYLKISESHSKQIAKKSIHIFEIFDENDV